MSNNESPYLGHLQSEACVIHYIDPVNVIVIQEEGHEGELASLNFILYFIFYSLVSTFHHFHVKAVDFVQSSFSRLGVWRGAIQYKFELLAQS